MMSASIHSESVRSTLAIGEACMAAATFKTATTVANATSQDSGINASRSLLPEWDEGCMRLTTSRAAFS